MKKVSDKMPDDVRIVNLPPMTVAAIRHKGEAPEKTTFEAIQSFIQEHNLLHGKADLRHFGFDSPLGSDEDEHGYERWVTIPEDLEVQEPFEKKIFQGGSYGAHTINMGDFEEWRILEKWVMNNGVFKYDKREPLINHGLIEEHLDVTRINERSFNSAEQQIVLLMPAKKA